MSAGAAGSSRSRFSRLAGVLLGLLVAFGLGEAFLGVCLHATAAVPGGHQLKMYHLCIVHHIHEQSASGVLTSQFKVF